MSFVAHPNGCKSLRPTPTPPQGGCHGCHLHKVGWSNWDIMCVYIYINMYPYYVYKLINICMGLEPGDIPYNKIGL